MFALTSIGFSLLIALGFSLGHLMVNLIERNWVFKRWKFDPYVIDVLIGLIYGVFTLALQLALWGINSDFNMCVGIITSLMLVTYRRWLMALVNGFFSIIFCTLAFNINLSTYVSFVVFFVLLMALFLARLWTLTHLEIKLLVFAALLFSLSYVISAGANDAWLTPTYLENTLLVIPGLIINLIIFRYVFKFIRSARQLQESSIYAPNGYLRYAVAQNNITSAIQQQKITRGWWVLFDFNFTPHAKAEINTEVERAVFNQLRLGLPQNVYWFNLSPKVNGFFWPHEANINLLKSLTNNALVTRPLDDALAPIELALTKASSTYLTTINTQVNVSIKAAAVIYNVQATTFEELEKMALQTLTWHRNQGNIVHLYDAQSAQIALREKAFVDQMDRELTLDDFTIEYLPVLKTNQQATNLLIVQATSQTSFASEVDLRKFLHLTNWASVFDRYVTSIAVQRLAKQKPDTQLLLPYAALSESLDYDFSLLAQKVVQLNVKPEQIILYASEITNRSLLIANVKNAKSFGFGVALSDQANAAVIKQVAPAWLIHDQTRAKGTISYNLERTIYPRLSLNEVHQLGKTKAIKYYTSTETITAI